MQILHLKWSKPIYQLAGETSYNPRLSQEDPSAYVAHPGSTKQNKTKKFFQIARARVFTRPRVASIFQIQKSVILGEKQQREAHKRQQEHLHEAQGGHGGLT